jgi:hypothetical protein
MNSPKDMGLKNNNHYGFDSQHIGGGGVYDHSTCMKILNLIMSYKVMGRMARAFVWICQPSHSNHMFHILREVG